MIQSRGISLDDEAILYVTSYFHQDKNLPEPLILQARVPKTLSTPNIAQKAICYRCGQAGHLASSCPNDLPDPAKIEDEMDSEVAALVAKLKDAGGYQEDEFGLYSIGENAVQANGSWNNRTFCPNCGKDHRMNQCPHKTFNEIYSELKFCLEKGSRYSSEQIRDTFMDIWQQPTRR